MLVVLSGCRRKDVQMRVISVPGVRTAAASNSVIKVVRRFPGVIKEECYIDLEKGELTAVYDTMRLALKNIEHAISEAGYDANEISAVPKSEPALQTP